jgi:hypothetical protein
MWAKSHYAEDAETSIAENWLPAMRPPLYRRHDLETGYITEHGMPGSGKLRKYLKAKPGVGLSHSSEESPGNGKGAKGLGYTVKS